MILVFELALAIIATARGHGFKPWGFALIAMAVALVAGIVVSATVSNPYDAVAIAKGFGLAVDIVILAGLGYMALVPPEEK